MSKRNSNSFNRRNFAGTMSAGSNKSSGSTHSSNSNGKRKSTFSNSNCKKARVLTYRREEESQDPDYEEWGGANNDDEYDDDDGVSSSLKRYLEDIIGKMFLFCDSYFSIGFINCFLQVKVRKG